jgi:hypothetical protein
MIEVIVKDHELQIYVNRKELADWLAGKGDVPWDGDPNSTDDLPGDSTDDKQDGGSSTDASEPQGQGYRTADGEKKEFPNPTEAPDPEKPENPEKVEGISLFDEGPNGIGGTLQDDAKGKEKIKALRDWLKAEKFNYKNFCVYLYQLKEVAGFKLSTPLIGLTQKKEPTIFQLATRFHSYWLSAKEDVARGYKSFLIDQLADMGITIQMVKDELDGEEIDPKNLPKGIEVSV